MPPNREAPGPDASFQNHGFLADVLHLAGEVPRLPGSSPTAAIDKVFREQPHLLGVVVDLDEGRSVLVTQAIYHELMARPFFREIYLRRKAESFVQHLRVRTLWATPESQLGPLLKEALSRPGRHGFEPLVCEIPGRGVCLVDLQKLLVERAEDLAEAARQVEQQRALVERASRAKTEFVANISHEIRTPLNGILGMSELLLDAKLPPPELDMLRTLRMSGEQLLAVLNDVLDLSKIEAGHLELEAIPFDLDRVVGEAAQMMCGRAATAGLRLGALVDARLRGTLRGDPTRLRQILLNLISNAIKFTEQGEVWVSASLRSAAEQALAIRIEVIDTGVGMSAEVRQQVFRPFVQGDNSTSRRHGGTGLGLAICRNLVQLMGGTIGVESTQGLGSVFWIELTLPCEQLPVAEPPPANPIVLLTHRTLGARLLLQALEGHQIQARGFTKQAEAIDWARSHDAAICFAMEEYSLGLDDSASGLQQIVFVHHGQQGPQGERVITMPMPIRDSDLIEVLRGTWLPTEAAVQRPVSARRERGKILVVEDNPVNHRVVSAMLQRAGYQVLVADSGTFALQVSSNRRFDAVLMDCQMPVLDGYETTRQWRAREQQTGGHTPIIALTANAMAGDRMRCFEAGMDDYLSKPVRRDRLEQVLDAWTGEHVFERQLEVLREMAIQAQSMLKGGDSPAIAQLSGYLLQRAATLLGANHRLLQGLTGADGLQVLAQLATAEP